MEDTLRVDETLENSEFSGLNPCFNGRYSQSGKIVELTEKKPRVLILVLMEDTLRDYQPIK